MNADKLKERYQRQINAGVFPRSKISFYKQQNTFSKAIRKRLGDVVMHDIVRPGEHTVMYGYLCLRDCVVARAVDDWLYAKLVGDVVVLSETERFFDSAFFTDLTAVDGQRFIKILQEKFDNFVKSDD